MFAVTALSLAVSCVLGFFLIRSAFHPKQGDREQYAFRCLGVISSLAVLAVTAISSKQGISDQLIALAAIALGSPLPEAPPAPRIRINHTQTGQRRTPPVSEFARRNNGGGAASGPLLRGLTSPCRAPVPRSPPENYPSTPGSLRRHPHSPHRSSPY